MSVKDFSNAWDEAAQRALVNGCQSELSPEQLSNAAGLIVRSGVASGSIADGRQQIPPPPSSVNCTHLWC